MPRRRNARGQYMSRRDRGMDYRHTEHGYGRGDYGYSHHEMREPMDYEHERRYDITYDVPHGRRDYGSFHEERGFRPVEAMGYFTGYYGGGEDYARSGRMRDYRYEEDYRMPRDYRDYADYGSERLERHEIDHWVEKLMKNLNPDEKEMLKMDKIMKKAQDMGIKFDKFSEDEFYVTVLMTYTDYKDTVGKSNIDMYVRLAKDWLCDEDTGVRYGEKLASYYDNVVEG